MQIKPKFNGYSNDLFLTIFGEDVSIIYLAGASGFSPKYEFKNGHLNRDKVDAVVAEFYFVNFGTCKVKFPSDYDSALFETLHDLDRVVLDQPEAVQVKNEVYIRARGAKRLGEAG